MEELKTMTEVARVLGISRPTLIKHVRIAEMELQSDRHDKRVKLLNEEQIEELRVIVNRVKK